jgi:hypothetical protein
MFTLPTTAIRDRLAIVLFRKSVDSGECMCSFCYVSIKLVCSTPYCSARETHISGLMDMGSLKQFAQAAMQIAPALEAARFSRAEFDISEQPALVASPLRLNRESVDSSPRC